MKVLKSLILLTVVAGLGFLLSACAASPSAASQSSSESKGSVNSTSNETATVSTSDLVAKAKSITDYSFESTISTASGSLKTKTFVKGAKMREEVTLRDKNSVMLYDTATKAAYMLVPDQNVAMKVDFTETASQGGEPVDDVRALPSGVKPSGVEVIDGKSTAVIDTVGTHGPRKYWIWIEKGVPLKAELLTSQGTETIEFANYQFDPQPDNLFQIPPGMQIVELPTVPSGTGSNPTPGR